MDARERSLLEEAQRQVASGRSLDTLVDVSFDVTVVPNDMASVAVRIENAADGMTRLYHAARWGWCSTITWLLEQGADVNVGKPDHGWTPLRSAVIYGHCDAAVLLLDAGARVDHRARDGRTALHYAADFGRIDGCKLLLSRGAQLDARNNSVEDAEDCARRRGKVAVVELLSAVRAAGGWAAYARAPRVQLLMLRILCERGRAVAPAGLLARLFPHETERRALPKDAFWHIVQFWPSDRD